ncbi:hypothetical protein HB162lentus_02780 [Mammaliicoccus lentus]
MKRYLFKNDGFILPFLLSILFVYSAFLSFYLVQYSYKIKIYNHLEEYYKNEIKIILNK